MGFSPRITSDISEAYQVPESKKSFITIKYIKPGVMQTLTQASMSVVSKQEKNSEKMVAEVSFDMHARNRDIVTACFEGWSGFEGKDGKPMKFTAANLVSMMDESVEFVDFVVECHEKLAETVEAETKVAEKN